MTDEKKERIKQHPCIAKNKEDCGAMYNFPHPQLKCSVDGHTALDIIGDLEQCLNWLYEDCPKKKGDI